MARLFHALLVAAGISLMPSQALAECKIGKFAELPVTMANRRPIVTLQINGRDARFILDSGASFSTMSAATAKEYGLSVRDIPNAEVRGIGGATTNVGDAVVSRLGIAGQTVNDVHFHVAGSDTGYAGLLGQNFLGLADVDYDLPHSVVRLTKATDCKNASMAYWAGSKPSAMVELYQTGEGQRHTIGTVTINGVKVKAAWDSGASGSLLTLAAAKRIGISPDKTGEKPNGFVMGIGQNRMPTWRTQFDAIDLGGEAINKPTITIIDQNFPIAEMMIGIDFFLTHHIYVDNANRRMFFTYEGGPLFGLNPDGAVDKNTGQAIDLTDRASEPTDAAGFSRRGAASASSQKYAAAITDFGKAIAMAPADGHYLFQRAQAYLSNRQPALALADLNKAVELAPNDAETRLLRARLRFSARDAAGAAADLQAADKALAPIADARLELAQAYEATGADEPALTSFDQWLKGHTEDHDRPTALAGRCRMRAVLNRELDKALDDCNTALRLRPNDPPLLESRALARIKRGEFDKAIADYDAVLLAQPANGWALYARGVAKQGAGNLVEAATDRTKAVSMNPQLPVRAKRYRLE